MFNSTALNNFLNTYRKTTETKRKLIFVLCSLLLFSAKAQDTIFKTDSIIIQAKVTEIGDAEIKYKKFSNPDGPIYNIKKTEVMMIVYQNGEKEIYNTIQAQKNIKSSEPLKTEIPVSTDSSSSPQPSINQQATSQPTAPAPIVVNGNYDLIATVNGDSIRCRINMIDNTMISYHINRRGFNPKGKILIAHVTKYFHKQQWHIGNGDTVSVANTIVPIWAPKKHIMQESVSVVYTLNKQNIGIGIFLRINYTYKNNIVWGVGLGLFNKEFKNEDFAADISNWSLILPLHIGYQIPFQKFRIVPTAGLFWGGVMQSVTGAFDDPDVYASDIGYFGELKVGYAIGDVTMIYLSAAYYNNFTDYNAHFFKATPFSAGILFKM